MSDFTKIIDYVRARRFPKNTGKSGGFDLSNAGEQHVITGRKDVVHTLDTYRKTEVMSKIEIEYSYNFCEACGEQRNACARVFKPNGVEVITVWFKKHGEDLF